MRNEVALFKAELLEKLGLIGQGVGPERIVALILPRTADMIIAMLAVWKAGGVYLPIDPTLPADRIDFLRQDADPVLVLDKIIDPTDASGTNPVVPLRPDNTAYVISPTPDLTPLNNSSSTHTPVIQPSNDITIHKSDSPDPIVPGNNLTYTINVSNA